MRKKLTIAFIAVFLILSQLPKTKTVKLTTNRTPYDYEKAKLIVKEMIDQHALDLFAKGLVTDQLVLDIGYDIENLTDPERSSKYHGEVTTARYGRKVPNHAHGTVNLQTKTSSSRVMTQAVVDLYKNHQCEQ